jgi:hypothetical protein
MVKLFKEKFTNYDETTLDNANQLNIKVNDMMNCWLIWTLAMYDICLCMFCQSKQSF